MRLRRRQASTESRLRRAPVVEAGRSTRITRHGRGRLEAVELGRRVHLRRLMRRHRRLWPVRTVSVRHGPAVSGLAVILAERERIDVRPRRRFRRRAKDEDPDDLGGPSATDPRQGRRRVPYRCRAKSNMTGRGRQSGRVRCVDERLHRRRGQDQASRRKAHDLRPSAGQSIQVGATANRGRSTYHHIIFLSSVEARCCDSENAKEHEHHRPPDVVREGVVSRAQMRDDAANEGDDPGRLQSKGSA